MLPTTIQKIIEGYIKAYNNQDVVGMLKVMHPEIAFENIANGEITLSLKGIEAFRAQAEEATNYFTQREQEITHLTIADNTAEAHIEYKAILAFDLPNGMKAGDKMELKGKSVFTFKDGKINGLQDIN